MAVTAGYYRRTVPIEQDPQALAVALARGETGPFVVYERADEWSFGAGSRAELVLDRDGIRLRTGGRWSRTPLGDQPLQRVNDLLAGLDIADWRAYGWAAFELGYLLHGPKRRAGAGPLLHLVVPEREVRLRAGVAELRAFDGPELAGLEAALREPVPEAPPTARATGDPTADGDKDGDTYRAAVRAAVDDIRAGRLQKVILSRVVPVDADLDLAATYDVGRRANTPARSFLFELGDLSAAGFSPETVVEVGAGGEVSTQPLAGTRARSGEAETDELLRAELLSDAKEIFEHAISVQAAQEELRGVCAPDSVLVNEFMAVRERGSVQHLASRVTGRLAADRNAWDAFAVLFPAITASGLPKAAACAAIPGYEDQPRGLYSGAVLTADADGGLDAALVLRTVFRQDGRTWLRAGAGIVEQSRPERELEETREKLRSISRFLVARADADQETAVLAGATRGTDER